MNRHLLAFLGFLCAALLSATSATAQEYQCCNLDKKSWRDGTYTIEKCLAFPKHDPRAPGYDDWQICNMSARNPGDDPKPSPCCAFVDGQTVTGTWLPSGECDLGPNSLVPAALSGDPGDDICNKPKDPPRKPVTTKSSGGKRQ